jgi:hypothetical protein
MSDEMNGTSALERLESRLQRELEQVKKTKTAINAICEAFDQPVRYPDADQEIQASQIRSDLFYGQPLATCVRSILEMRRSANRGAATVNEIHAALTAGGYAFETKDENNAKRGLRISLSKNPIFHKVPGGEWGLLEWYPNAKVDKKEDQEEDQSKDATAAGTSVAGTDTKQPETPPVPPPPSSPPPRRTRFSKPGEPGGGEPSGNEKAASLT